MNQETQALHIGYEKQEFGTMSVPIYQTTAYDFRDADHAVNLFALKELGPIYTRLNNPTTDVLEARLAAVEKWRSRTLLLQAVTQLFCFL